MTDTTMQYNPGAGAPPTAPPYGSQPDQPPPSYVPPSGGLQPGPTMYQPPPPPQPNIVIVNTGTVPEIPLQSRTVYRLSVLQVICGCVLMLCNIIAMAVWMYGGTTVISHGIWGGIIVSMR